MKRKVFRVYKKRAVLQHGVFVALSFVLIAVILSVSIVSCSDEKLSSFSSSGISKTETETSSIAQTESVDSIETVTSEIVSQAESKVESAESSNVQTSSKPNVVSSSSRPSASQNVSQSVGVSSGNVAQSGNFDVYKAAENWTYHIDISKPVPLQPCVDNSFFSDVMFVGDSITTGIDLYNIVTGCSVAAYTGINTNTIMSSAVLRNKAGKKVTFLQYMSQYNPKHIYIMLGINGIAFQSKEKFISGYSDFVDGVKKMFPNAKIYLQTILPVTNKKQNSDSRFANSKIDNYNAAVALLARQKGVYFLNVAEAFKDANGNLPANASSDGIHFGPAHYRLWIEYIKRHTVYTGVIPQDPPAAPEPEIGEESKIESSTSSDTVLQ